MDIFSAGFVIIVDTNLLRITIGFHYSVFIFDDRCVLAELFSDGRQLFDLSQLLSYRNNEFEQVPHILKDIEDPAVRVRSRSVIDVR